MLTGEFEISFTQCSPNSPPVTEICDNFQISSARLFEAEKIVMKILKNVLDEICGSTRFK